MSASHSRSFELGFAEISMGCLLKSRAPVTVSVRSGKMLAQDHTAANEKVMALRSYEVERDRALKFLSNEIAEI